MTVPAKNAIYQLLSTNGDGTGTTSQKVNGSVTPVVFYIQPPTGESYVLRRMNIFAIAANFNNASLYGGLTLAVGIKVRVEDKTGLVKNYTPLPIKRHNDWSLLSGVDSVSIGEANNDPFLVRWTFARGADDIILNGDEEEKFIVEINDNMTGLVDQLCLVQGYTRDNKEESNL